MANNLTISYAGNTIKELDESQEFKLTTAGKFMSDDLIINVNFESGASIYGPITAVSGDFYEDILGVLPFIPKIFIGEGTRGCVVGKLNNLNDITSGYTTKCYYGNQVYNLNASIDEDGIPNQNLNGLCLYIDYYGSGTGHIGGTWYIIG